MALSMLALRVRAFDGDAYEVQMPAQLYWLYPEIFQEQSPELFKPFRNLRF